MRRAGGSCCSLVREAGGSSWYCPCSASAELPGHSLTELGLPRTSASFGDRLRFVSGTTLLQYRFLPKGLPPTPVQLLYPVSRFSNVKSLQHLCRFRIRQLVRIDHIPELPLPK